MVSPIIGGFWESEQEDCSGENYTGWKLEVKRIYPSGKALWSMIDIRERVASFKVGV
jgi:hypothetical protein